MGQEQKSLRGSIKYQIIVNCFLVCDRNMRYYEIESSDQPSKAQALCWNPCRIVCDMIAEEHRETVGCHQKFEAEMKSLSWSLDGSCSREGEKHLYIEKIFVENEEMSFKLPTRQKLRMWHLGQLKYYKFDWSQNLFISCFSLWGRQKVRPKILKD